VAGAMEESFLVTGGQGFIGAWVVRRLLLEGARFAILDRAPDDRILEMAISPDAVRGLRRYCGDIAERDFVLDAVRRCEATRIIHLAGLQVPACRADPLAGARVNVIGTLNVFEAARLVPSVQVVAYASSAAAGGGPEDYLGPIHDDARQVPRTHYGVFKAANEGNARVYHLDHGIQSVGLRPLVVYGPGREIGLTSGPTKAIKAAVLGRPYRIGFTGLTGFLYVSDAADLFLACARSRPGGAVALNIRGEVAPVEEFAGIIEAEVPGAKVTCEGPPIPIAYDFEEKGLEDLLGKGAIPRTPLRKGILTTLEIFRSLYREGRLHDRDLE
jgi:nucleoside-diphosphate-sugar epimerase